MDINESLLKIQSLGLSSSGKGNTSAIEKPTKTEVIADSTKAPIEEVQSSTFQNSLVEDHDLDDLLDLQESSPKLSTRKPEALSVTPVSEG